MVGLDINYCNVGFLLNATSWWSLFKRKLDFTKLQSGFLSGASRVHVSCCLGCWSCVSAILSGRVGHIFIPATATTPASRLLFRFFCHTWQQARRSFTPLVHIWGLSSTHQSTQLMPLCSRYWSNLLSPHQFEAGIYNDILFVIAVFMGVFENLDNIFLTSGKCSHPWLWLICGLSVIIVIYFWVNISIKWVINIQNQPRVFQKTKSLIISDVWRKYKKSLLQAILQKANIYSKFNTEHEKISVVYQSILLSALTLASAWI